jgi:hypothetical protein
VRNELKAGPPLLWLGDRLCYRVLEQQITLLWRQRTLDDPIIPRPQIGPELTHHSSIQARLGGVLADHGTLPAVLFGQVA